MPSDEVASARQTPQHGAHTHLLVGGPADGVRVVMVAGECIRIPEVLPIKGRAPHKVIEHRYLRTAIHFAGQGDIEFYRHENMTAAESTLLLVNGYPVMRP